MFSTKNLFKIAGKHIIIAIVSILISSALVVFLSGQITKVAEKEATDRRLASLLSERTVLLSNIKSESNIIGSTDRKIEDAFIPSNDILGFVSILENLALKFSVTPSYSFSSPVATDSGNTFPIASINFQNNLSVNIDVLVSYLRNFEELPYFTKIDSLNILSPKGWHNESSVSYSASILTRAVQ